MTRRTFGTLWLAGEQPVHQIAGTIARTKASLSLRWCRVQERELTREAQQRDRNSAIGKSRNANFMRKLEQDSWEAVLHKENQHSLPKITSESRPLSIFTFGPRVRKECPTSTLRPHETASAASARPRLTPYCPPGVVPPLPARPQPRNRARRQRRPLASNPRSAAVPGAAWPPPTAVAGVVALCRWARAHRGSWVRSRRPCPRAYPHLRHSHPRGPSLRPRCSSRPSAVLRPPRTPAAHDATSPSAYTRRFAPTWTAQTGLSWSTPSLVHVLRPIPRQDSRWVLPRTSTPRTWPSPRHARLGSRIVALSRRQASLDVAARALAPSVEAFDAPLRPRQSLAVPGACYQTLRRLSRRDSYSLAVAGTTSRSFVRTHHARKA